MNKVNIWRTNENAVLPDQANSTDVGYDLYTSEDVIIKVGQYLAIPTDIVVEPPEDYHFEIFLRSSTPKKFGLLLGNGVGLVDPSYSSEADRLWVLVHKFGVGTLDQINYTPLDGEHYISHIKKGTRLAQLVLRKTEYFEVVDMTGKPNNNKERQGIGSSGV